MEGAFAVAEGSHITPQDLPPYLLPCSHSGPSGSYKEQLTAFERKLLLDTIAASATKTQAA